MGPCIYPSYDFIKSTYNIHPPKKDNEERKSSKISPCVEKTKMGLSFSLGDVTTYQMLHMLQLVIQTQGTLCPISPGNAQIIVVTNNPGRVVKGVNATHVLHSILISQKEPIPKTMDTFLDSQIYKK